jgi:hypothetical protein
VGDGGAHGGQYGGTAADVLVPSRAIFAPAPMKTADFLDNGIYRRAADGGLGTGHRCGSGGRRFGHGKSERHAGASKNSAHDSSPSGWQLHEPSRRKACHPQCFEGRFEKVFIAKYVRKGEQGRR